MRRKLRFALVPAVVFTAAVVAVAVGRDAGAASKGTIIFFGPTSSNNYVAQLFKGAKSTAAAKGYTLKIIENNFDQSEEDVQVQQQLASGDKPLAYGWWPSDNKAGIASQRRLSQSGVPVFMVNQLPIKGTDKYWTAYAGVNDVLNGQVAGRMVLKARAALQKAGHTLHGKGQYIEVRFPAGYSAGDDRDKGFAQATKGSGLKRLASQPAGFDPAAGYKIGAQLIAANKSKGIDLVYAQNSALSDGAIQALQEAGYKPGKDVMVVGGTCHGNIKPLIQGKEFGTGLQAARLEGVYMLQVIAKYLANGGKVTAGSYTAPPTRNTAPAITKVYRYNFIPNPAVIGKQAQTTKLWGFTMKQLCTY
jgi:ABC-type sugar transport system substrate-binding protein